MAVVHVEPRALLLEPNPTVQHERSEPIARFLAEGRRGVQPVGDLGRVDPQQPHAPVGRHVDRIAVDDGSHQHGVGSGGVGGE